MEIPLPGPVFTSPINMLYHKYGVTDAELRIVSKDEE